MPLVTSDADTSPVDQNTSQLMLPHVQFLSRLCTTVYFAVKEVLVYATASCCVGITCVSCPRNFCGTRENHSSLAMALHYSNGYINIFML